MVLIIRFQQSFSQTNSVEHLLVSENYDLTFFFSDSKNFPENGNQLFFWKILFKLKCSGKNTVLNV